MNEDRESLLSFRRGGRVAGHPLHTLLVHFPLALWMLVLPLELAGAALAWAPGWRYAFWANVLALACSLPTLLTGLLDLVSMEKERGPGRAAETANRHMYVMLTAAAVFLGEAALRGGASPPVGSRAFLNLGLSLCGTLLLTWGGWLGGELVFRHGVGTRFEEERARNNDGN